MEPKYPHVTVQLTGINGNAFVVMGAVTLAMRRGGCNSEEIEEFRSDASSSDYDHLLQTCFKYVEVE